MFGCKSLALLALCSAVGEPSMAKVALFGGYTAQERSRYWRKGGLRRWFAGQCLCGRGGCGGRENGVHSDVHKASAKLQVRPT